MRSTITPLRSRARLSRVISFGVSIALLLVFAASSTAFATDKTNLLAAILEAAKKAADGKGPPVSSKPQPLDLKESGSFFMEGSTQELDAATSTRQPGLYMTDQMYVQFMKPKNGKKHVPIVFVHGGGLSAKSWQTTPDGRMGWDEYFVHQGFDTYLVDQVSRGRSGFDATAYNKVRNGALVPTEQAPILMATDQLAWNGFRWGTTRCTVSPCATTTTPHPGIRFPMKTVGVGAGSDLQFYAQIIAVPQGTLPGSPPGCTGSACAPADPGAPFSTPTQLAKLARKLDGAILVGHSESADFPTRAALQPSSGCYPYTTKSACKVKGIIQMETGCFANLTPAQIKTLSRIPILIQFGDFSPVPQPADPCPLMIQQITEAGGDIKFAWIPHLTKNSLYKGSPGPITGNDHMIMMDNNNLEIAQILINWASSRGL